MKILKIFGIVVGIHLFALILIFANPGCSSTTKPTPSPADTVGSAEPAPVITVPAASQPASGTAYADTVNPTGFNPDAPATYSGTGGGGVRFTPTRPNTPAAQAVLAQPVENVTPAATYTVKSGDSLWTLQKKFHVDYREIAAANNMRTDTPIHAGQKLIIPGKSPNGGSKTKATAGTAASSSLGAAPAAKSASSPASRPTNGEFKYTVKPGETLGGIAHKFGVSARELGVHNNIQDPLKLRAGTELSIPGWQPTSGAGSTSRSAAAAPKPADTTTSEPQQAPATVPSIPLDQPSPAQPTPSQTSSVPVINIDETPVTPAPNS